MNKQLLMDFLVVLVAPVCFVAAYHFILDTEITTNDLLSMTAQGDEVAAPGVLAGELGAKSKEILTNLKSINFDQSFFTDPVYLSLEDFTPAYSTTSIGRDYPFAIPDEITEMVRDASADNTGASSKATEATSKAKSVVR